mgnify:CR=1 FL=1
MESACVRGECAGVCAQCSSRTHPACACLCVPCCCALCACARALQHTRQGVHTGHTSSSHMHALTTALLCITPCRSHPTSAAAEMCAASHEAAGLRIRDKCGLEELCSCACALSATLFIFHAFSGLSSASFPTCNAAPAPDSWET